MSRRALLWLTGLAMLALLAVLVVLEGRMKATGGPGIIPFELAGTRERADDIIARWGQPGTDAARLSLLLDCPYLIAYGAFWALACAACRDLARGRGWDTLARLGRATPALAVAAAGCDALENVGLLVALGGGGGSAAPALAAVFASLKFLLTTLVIVYVLVALARRLFGR